MPGRLFAIGDIHGCAAALRALLDLIAPEPDDVIITLGDVIDYGPDSRSVVEQLMELDGRCRLIPIKGNHEEMLLQALDDDEQFRFWLRCGGKPTLESHGVDVPHRIDRRHIEFIHSFRSYWETDRFIFTHANYDPILPMSRHSSLELRWMFVVPRDQKPHYSNKTVIVGHTPQVSGFPLDLGFLRVIDTDCSRGGRLTALEVETGALYQSNQQGTVWTGSLSST